MLNQLNTTTKRELDTRYLVNSDILQGSKEITNTSGTFSIPDYGLTESIEMFFEPSQNLNGYSKPWAGGNGKNKLNPSISSQTINGIVVTKNKDGSYLCNGTANADVMLYFDTFNTDGNSYILSGCPPTGSYSTYCLGVVDNGTDYGTGLTFSHSGKPYIRIGNGYECPSGGLLFKPMIRLASESDATFEPYANICPIIGQSNAAFSWGSDNELKMLFGSTYYGGIANFDGTIYPDWDIVDLGSLTWVYSPNWGGHPAFYTAELREIVKAPQDNAKANAICSAFEIMSRNKLYSLDVAGLAINASGDVNIRDYRYNDATSFKNAMSGIQLVYEKVIPTQVRVTPPANLNLTDDYPIEYNGYKAIIKYQPKDTILEDAKSYTNQKIEKLGLPQAPISNGSYHLECTVSSGTPTISWVDNQP